MNENDWERETDEAKGLWAGKFCKKKEKVLSHKKYARFGEKVMYEGLVSLYFCVKLLLAGFDLAWGDLVEEICLWIVGKLEEKCAVEDALTLWTKLCRFIINCVLFLVFLV